MTQLFGLYLLWFGFLVIRFSCQLREDLSRTRRLCGRYLVKEIEKLCGSTNWSQFQLEAQFLSQASEKTEAFNPDNYKRLHISRPQTSSPQTPSPQTPLPEPGKITNPASTSASQQKTTHGLKIPPLSDTDKEAENNIGVIPSLSDYQPENWHPEETGEFPSSHDVKSYIHESIKFQKKSKNKIKTSQSLFWGNHPQRKRRGFSTKCCLKGCTKGELAIACLPYIDFYNSHKKDHHF